MMAAMECRSFKRNLAQYSNRLRAVVVFVMR